MVIVSGKIRTALVSVSLLMSVFYAPLLAAELQFTGERIPTMSDNLSTDYPEGFHLRDCQEQRKWHLKKYTQLYPDVADKLADPVVLREWRMALILNRNGNPIPERCFYDPLVLGRGWESLLFFTNKKDGRVLFCGRKADDIEADVSWRLDDIEELLIYAMAGKLRPLDYFLSERMERKWLKLNPGIFHYLALSAAHVGEQGYPRYFKLAMKADKAAEGRVSIDRGSFIEAAFEKGDFRAVLSSTAHCRL